MNKNKIILTITTLIVITVIIFSIIFLKDLNSYRSQLPDGPNLANISKELKDKITSAQQKARRRPNGKNLGMLGMVYYSSAYYDEAAVCFELASQKDPVSWEWDYYHGNLYLEMGESTIAAKHMKSVIKKNPEVWLAWYRLSEAYVKMDSTKIAEELLNKIINLDEKKTYTKNTIRSRYYPIQIYAQLLLGKIYMSTKRPELAEKELLDISNKYLSFGPAFRQLGILYAQLGNEVQSNKYSDRANDLIVYNIPLDTLMDRLSLMSGSETYVLKQLDNAAYGSDPKMCYELTKHALKNIPNNKYVLSKAIKQFARIGMRNEVVPLIDKHFMFFKDSYTELEEVGVLLADAGLKNEAAMYLEHALTLKDLNPEQKVKLATLLFERAGVRDKAIATMQEVTENNLENTDILGEAVLFMGQAGETEKAVIYYNKLKHLSPNDENVKIFEGITAANKGDIIKACALFEEAFEINPQKKSLIKHLTYIYIQNELWNKAERFFRNALYKYPNDSELQMQLGLLLVSCPDENLRNLSEGKELSERAFYNSIYTINNRISAGRTLAIANYQMGDQQKAQYYISQTIDLAIKNKAPDNYLQGLRNLARSFSSNN